MDEVIPTPYSDLWFVEGLHGELIPMYSDWNCERAAIEAFVRGNYDALTVEEIEFMKDALS